MLKAALCGLADWQDCLGFGCSFVCCFLRLLKVKSVQTWATESGPKLTSGGLWYTDDRVDRLASRMSSKAGSRLLLVSAMTGFSASTTSLAASGSVDNSRLHTNNHISMR